MTVQTLLPCGIRNNNPLNIRFNPENRWQGKVPPKHNSDGAFEQFHYPTWGCACLRPILAAMIRIENGRQPYTDAQIDAALVAGRNAEHIETMRRTVNPFSSRPPAPFSRFGQVQPMLGAAGPLPRQGSF